MGLARAANLPVVIVGDIDRGGLLAHLFGTVAVLDAEDQALIAGFIVNKFRGDVSLLEPGLRQLAVAPLASAGRADRSDAVRGP